jgi:hypothetical protein
VLAILVRVQSGRDEYTLLRFPLGQFNRRLVSRDIKLNAPDRIVSTISAARTIGVARAAPLILPLMLAAFASVEVDKYAGVAIRIERAIPSTLSVFDVVRKTALQVCEDIFP